MTKMWWTLSKNLIYSKQQILSSFSVLEREIKVAWLKLSIVSLIDIWVCTYLSINLQYQKRECNRYVSYNFYTDWSPKDIGSATFIKTFWLSTLIFEAMGILEELQLPTPL